MGALVGGLVFLHEGIRTVVCHGRAPITFPHAIYNICNLFNAVHNRIVEYLVMAVVHHVLMLRASIAIGP